MQEHINSIIDIAKEYSSASKNVIALLVRYKENDIEKYLPDLLKVDEYKGSDGNLHVSAADFDALCSFNPSKYEHYVLNIIPQLDCKTCIAEMHRILKEYYGDKYRQKVYDKMKDTLVYISTKHNDKGNRYQMVWSGANRYTDGTPRFIEWILQHYGQEAKQAIFDYVENTSIIDLDVITVAVKHLGQDAVEIAAEGLNMEINSNDLASHFRKTFQLLSPLNYSAYYDKVWEVASSEYKEIRQTACKELSKLDNKIVIPKAVELLSSKKGHEREAGIYILSLINTPETQAILKPLLNSEKNDDARDIIVTAFYSKEDSITAKEITERVASAKARKKLDKPVAKWLDEASLPALKWLDNKEVDLDTVRFLFYRQTRQKEITPDPEAKAIYSFINKETSGEFSLKLLEMVLRNGGAKAQNRFALSVIGLLGDSRIIAPLQELAISTMNENACVTLGLQHSFDAARALDKIMQEFRTRYPNVKATAKEAFDGIADKMKLTPFELSDIMVPDFGFTDLKKIIKVGNEELTLKISSDLKLCFTDTNKKAVKSLPKDASETLKKELKELGIFIREMGKQQKINLENYLVIQRRWNKGDWGNFFLGNPLAFAFAQYFVWGMYEKDKTELFTVNSQAASVDIKNKPVSLSSTSQIGLVHPLDITEAEQNEWKQFMASLNVSSAFEQIDRETFVVTEENKSQTISSRFDGKSLNCGAFKSRAEKLGWRRGSVVDSGAISSYRKVFSNEQVEVFVNTEGLGVGFDFEETMLLGDFYFVKLGSVATGSYIYDEPRDEKDERLIKFGDVPKIIYSETIADLTKSLKQKVMRKINNF